MFCYSLQNLHQQPSAILTSFVTKGSDKCLPWQMKVIACFRNVVGAHLLYFSAAPIGLRPYHEKHLPKHDFMAQFPCYNPFMSFALQLFPETSHLVQEPYAIRQLRMYCRNRKPHFFQDYFQDQMEKQCSFRWGSKCATM